MKINLVLIIFIVTVFFSSPFYGRAEDNKVLIGLNVEIGHPTSTSDDAIKEGILVAMDEINRAGGVLGGRKLELIQKDNRSVPARALQNNREFAAMPNLVAVFGGKFSSAIIESLPVIHELKLPLMAPWSANDKVIDNGYMPNYVFRLSIRDTWAVNALMSYAQKKGFHKVGLILTNTIWGRSNQAAIQEFVATHRKVEITSTQWFNYGEKSMLEKYEAIRRSRAQAVILITIESEGALMVTELAQLPAEQRLPLLASASVTGGDFPKMTGEALRKVDLVFPQTYNLHERQSARVNSVMATAERLFGIKDAVDIKSPMGFVHAYDLMRILALAIDKAGSIDRIAIHDALEEVTGYEGLIMRYQHPFTKTRHEALNFQNVIMARYDSSGVIRKMK